MNELNEKKGESDRAEAGEEQLDQLTPSETEQVETLGAVVDSEGEAAPGTMKIDLHCHSEASHDCITPLDLFPARCLARQVLVQAITDHNQIWGAQKLKEKVEDQAEGAGRNLTVIVGEEVSTSEGEIIGLFLEERVEPGLSPEETIEQIKAQGGLVLLPHGFDPLKRWRLKPYAIERIASSIDIVETFNARISQPRWNQAAVSWAQKHGVLMSAGSDAHTLADIGSAWVEVPRQAIHSPKDLVEALRDGTPVGQWTHPGLAFAYKLWDRTRRKLFPPK
jgi:predicted metal-dependent phosphoesterase TrpH